MPCKALHAMQCRLAFSRPFSKFKYRHFLMPVVACLCTGYEFLQNAQSMGKNIVMTMVTRTMMVMSVDGSGISYSVSSGLCFS